MNKDSISVELREYIITDYKEGMENARHEERMQIMSIQWFLFVVGGLLAFLFAGPSSETKTIKEILTSPESYVPLGFLVAYSIIQNLLLLEMKKREWMELDRVVENVKILLGDEYIMVGGITTYVFTLRLYLALLVGCGCVFIFSLTLTSWQLEMVGLPSVVISLIIATLYFLLFRHIRRNVLKTLRGASRV